MPSAFTYMQSSNVFFWMFRCAFGGKQKWPLKHIRVYVTTANVLATKMRFNMSYPWEHLSPNNHSDAALRVRSSHENRIPSTHALLGNNNVITHYVHELYNYMKARAIEYSAMPQGIGLLPLNTSHHGALPEKFHHALALNWLQNALHEVFSRGNTLASSSASPINWINFTGKWTRQEPSIVARL